MKLIDLHCDTISKIHRSNKNINLYENNLHVDIKKLKSANSIAQFFAMFIEYGDKPDIYENYFDYLMSMLDEFYMQIEQNSEHIALATNYDELIKNIENNKISAFLTVEEGGVIGNNLYNLRNLYRLGVRLITLTWNFPNILGYPNYKKEYMDKGLTEFGIEAVKEMNRLGMLVDVSHLSDTGFYDVAKISQKPFIASHSNSREIKNHPRNLTNNMIKVISNNGGIIGINFCPSFIENNKSSVEGLIKHIKNIKKIGGIDCISMGSDFDGISGNLEIKNIGKMNKLIISLEKEGFSTEEIEKIFYRNALRVIKEVMR